MSKYLNVLVIDDEVSSLLPVVEITQVLGCDTRLAFDGLTAISEFRKRAADLIIVDWLMPYAGGAQALKLIDKYWQENTNDPAKKIPFLIYSGLEKEQIQVPETESLKFIGHLEKPITLAELTRKLNLLFK